VFSCLLVKVSEGSGHGVVPQTCEHDEMIKLLEDNQDIFPVYDESARQYKMDVSDLLFH
jgi:hypothetical protein